MQTVIDFYEIPIPIKFRVSIPTEPEFMKSVRQSPYSDPKWIANIKHGILVDKNKNEINAKEQEAHLTVLRDERDAQDRVRKLM